MILKDLQKAIVLMGDNWENKTNLKLLDDHIRDFMSEPTYYTLEELKTVCGLIPIKS